MAKVTKKTSKKNTKKNFQSKNKVYKKQDGSSIGGMKSILYTFVGLFIVIILWLFLSSSIMSKDATTSVDSNNVVKAGDVVSVWYVGKYINETVFDTNIESVALDAGKEKPSYQPLSFIVGAGQMIKGFDEAVVNMSVGEKKTITIEPEDAYGPYKAELVRSVSYDEFEEAFFPVANATEGMVLPVKFSNGAVGNIKIDTIGSDYVKLDMNHELAGKKLVFDIEIESVNSTEN